MPFKTKTRISAGSYLERTLISLLTTIQYITEKTVFYFISTDGNKKARFRMLYKSIKKSR